MTEATHLIAIDLESGLLWGGVPMASGMDGLLAAVVAEADGARLSEVDAETDHEAPVTGRDVWGRCDVFEVVLTDGDDPGFGKRVYSGHDCGWLPDGKRAAFGHRVAAGGWHHV